MVSPKLGVGLVFVSTLALNACSSTSTPPPPNAPAPSMSAPTPAQPAVEAALHEAAAHLNTDAAGIHVERVEARQWPDRALGCPRQGIMYAQIVTPGYVIVLSGGSRELEYHTDETGRVLVLCQER